MDLTDDARPPHASVLDADVAVRGNLRITRLGEPQGLRIEGDLDHTTLPALRRALTSLVPGDIDIDLKGLTFIDVGGLRALVTAAALLDDGHVMTLWSAPPQVERLLLLTRWHERSQPRLVLRSPAIAPGDRACWDRLFPSGRPSR
ncbi:MULTISPECIES: STAS domain-containing protein [Nonomuraea]|uniref:STAS domain-containing protein n=1 Tax=Nonomuraea recticatena TaxID=46178 RepID=A0ABN3R7S5_9ACTN